MAIRQIVINIPDLKELIAYKLSGSIVIEILEDGNIIAGAEIEEKDWIELSDFIKDEISKK